MTSADPPATTWRHCPADLADDERFIGAIRRLHDEIDQQYFAHDPLANRRLKVQTRALRRIQGWRVLLVLTPWMLSRLLVPDRAPAIPIPPDWRADAQRDATYRVLGPRVTLEILGQNQNTHLNYHPLLGHYLLQPIALNMESYATPDAVFDAWNKVIRRRDENMEQHGKNCPWQKEVSRRELFERFRGGY